MLLGCLVWHASASTCGNLGRWPWTDLGVVVPIFTKQDRRLFSNYRGITPLSLPRNINARELERRVHPLVKPQMQEERMWFLSWLWNSGSLSSQQYLRVHGSLSNQCTFVDLEKLFIRIPHSILWGMLQEYRVLACCWVIQSVYNCVQFLGGASWWKAFTLVATGSPLLFADDEVPANLDQGRVAPPTGGV